MRLRLYVNRLCCVFVPIVRDLLCMSARDVSFKAIENKKVLEVVQDRIIDIHIKFSDDKGTRLLENTIPILPIFNVDAFFNL